MWSFKQERPFTVRREAYRNACYAFHKLHSEKVAQKFYCSASVLPYAVIRPAPAPAPADTFGNHHDQLLRWMTDTPGNADEEASKGNKVVFLLGGEVRRDKRAPVHSVDQGSDSDLFWSDFGGKREQTDTSFVQTALREFNEETAGLFAAHSDWIHSQMKSPCSLKVWNGAGFSILFLVEVPYLPNASSQFYELFTNRVAAVRAEVEAKLELSRRGEFVTVSKELMGTMNKCAVRWVPKEDFLRIFTMPQGDKDTPCCLTLIEWPQPAPPTPDQKATTTTTTTTPSPEPSAFMMQIYPYFMGYLKNDALREAITALHHTAPPVRSQALPQALSWNPAQAPKADKARRWREEMAEAEREQAKAMEVVSAEEAELLKKLEEDETELLKKMEEEEQKRHDPTSSSSWCWW